MIHKLSGASHVQPRPARCPHPLLLCGGPAGSKEGCLSCSWKARRFPGVCSLEPGQGPSLAWLCEPAGGLRAGLSPTTLSTGAAVNLTPAGCWERPPAWVWRWASHPQPQRPTQQAKVSSAVVPGPSLRPPCSLGLTGAAPWGLCGRAQGWAPVVQVPTPWLVCGSVESTG